MIDATVSTANPRIALRMHHRYLASSNRRIEVIALRRPDVTVRQTDFRGFVVDERVLTKAFPWTVRTDRLQVLLVLDGHVLWDDLELGPMDVALLRPEQQALARFANARFVDVDGSHFVVYSFRLRMLIPYSISARTTEDKTEIAGGTAP